jgi:hypothetical protein
MMTLYLGLGEHRNSCCWSPLKHLQCSIDDSATVIPSTASYTLLLFTISMRTVKRNASEPLMPAEVVCWQQSALAQWQARPPAVVLALLTESPATAVASAATAGDYFHPDNYPNMAALLSLYAVMPAFAAVAYIPSITLGEPFSPRYGCLRP